MKGISRHYPDLALRTVLLLLAVTLLLIVQQDAATNLRPQLKQSHPQSRRLSEKADAHDNDLEHVLTLATRTADDTFTEDSTPFRVLFIVTTLAEYDKGTRGTTHGADRLKDNVLPLIVDGVTDMVSRGWSVDVYLICGFEDLKEERRRMIVDALPENVGFEYWDSAIPFYYVKKFNQDLKKPDQTIELAPHGLSRQHRFVVRDKLMDYDFFTAFEDDMRIMSSHVVNFLEMSVEIDRMRRLAEKSPSKAVSVEDALEDHRSTRGKSQDKANVGNDLVQDPMTAEDLRRLWPGFIRSEVIDNRSGGSHPLLGGGGGDDRPEYLLRGAGGEGANAGPPEEGRPPALGDGHIRDGRETLPGRDRLGGLPTRRGQGGRRVLLVGGGPQVWRQGHEEAEAGQQSARPAGRVDGHEVADPVLPRARVSRRLPPAVRRVEGLGQRLAPDEERSGRILERGIPIVRKVLLQPDTVAGPEEVFEAATVSLVE
ncbi:hypothetical protein THAOC_10306 [Thalassiosira oceanica]|uniref:Uncharacterized protein n=1 Tax=Thalassiosira oceanica TaxID=159749 RepID=K0SQB1_THAOC|nr:hypothetical protein THAOC_10306 [Thalassiosira oceanica]|eukprot:EJK68503.1 hypothetical protein THAOC_10306 [Thalassiosira oceanica]